MGMLLARIQKRPQQQEDDDAQIIEQHQLQAAFTSACRTGNLRTAKDIYYNNLTSFTPINISANSEEAFNYACKYGHYDVVKWLLSVKPSIDIHANGDEALYFAKQYKYHKIIQLLQS